MMANIPCFSLFLTGNIISNSSYLHQFKDNLKGFSGELQVNQNGSVRESEKHNLRSKYLKKYIFENRGSRWTIRKGRVKDRNSLKQAKNGNFTVSS